MRNISGLYSSVDGAGNCVSCGEAGRCQCHWHGTDVVMQSAEYGVSTFPRSTIREAISMIKALRLSAIIWGGRHGRDHRSEVNSPREESAVQQ